MRILRWLSMGLIAILLAGLALPFSATGTQLLLGLAQRALGVTIDYRSGALLGQLELKAVSYEASGVRISLAEISARVSRDCLWRSEVCLDALHIQDVSVAITGDDADEVASGDDDFAVPFIIVANGLVIDLIEVAWPGGRWQSERHDGSARLAGSRITLSGLRVGNALLEIDEDDAPGQPRIELPDIRLPLRLSVQDAQLGAGELQLGANRIAIADLTLDARWREHDLRIAGLSLHSELFGTLALGGELKFQGDWPLDATAELAVSGHPDLPLLLHDRMLELHASGDLAELTLQLEAAGQEHLSLALELDALAADLPFDAVGELSWDGQQPFPQQLAQLYAASPLVLESPLRLQASGDLRRQRLAAQLSASAYNYTGAQLEFSGQHHQGMVEVETLAFSDEASDSELQLSGLLNYEEGLRWQAALESGGFALPEAISHLSGRLAGALVMRGALLAERWEIAVSDSRLEGTINNLPALIQGDLALDSERWLSSAQLTAELNAARLQLDKRAQEAARLDLEIDDMARWSAGGRGSAELHITEADAVGEYTATGRTRNLGFGAVQTMVTELQGKLSIDGAMPFDVSLSAEDIAVGDLRSDSAQLSITGDRNRQSATLESSGDLASTVRASGLADEAGWSGQLEVAKIESPLGAWEIEQPLGLEYAGAEQVLEIAAHCWSSSQAQLCLDPASVGSSGAISGKLQGDLQLLNALVASDYNLSGGLSARLVAGWAEGEPARVEAAVELSAIRLEQALDQGEIAVYELDGGAIDLNAGPRGVALQAVLRRDAVAIAGLSLNLPPNASDQLQGQLQLQDFELAPIASFVGQLATLDGSLNGTVVFSGSPATPMAHGTLRLSDGTFLLVGDSNQLSGVAADLVLRGDMMEFVGTGSLGGGDIAIDGSAVLRPTPEITLSLRGTQNHLQIQPYSELQVSTDFKLVANPELVDVSGTVTVHDGRLAHERLPEGSVSVSADVVEVDFAGNAIRQESPFATRADVRVRILDKFRVVGSAVDVTVGGDLRLQQVPRQPMQLFGNLNVIGGEVRAYGQRLEVKQGSIAFTGDVDNPELNLRAGRDIPLERIRVGVAMTGTLEEPVLEIYSDPAMTQTAALSWLLRGRGPDSGAGADGTAMAVSLGAGVLNQSGVVTGINRLPGLSNVEFGAEGSEDDTAATVSGYIGERIYVSYGVGIYEPINVLTARLYLQARLWLEVVSRLENSADIYYSFDID